MNHAPRCRSTDASLGSKSLGSLVPLALAASALAPHVADGVAWSPDWQTALDQAKEGNKVVFLAVNMDGERANDRMVELYGEKQIEKLAAHTINAVASATEHKEGDKPCPRFGEITCKQHRAVDVAVRSQVLKPDAEGFVIAPQHVFLAPDGKVILSVPYEIDESELVWCFERAIHAVDPEADLGAIPRGRAPKRLVLGDVIDLGGLPGGGLRPITREEALELIDLVKRGGLDWQQRLDALRKIMTSDEEEARDLIVSELRAGNGGRGGGGRGGGGAGGAGGMGGSGADRRPLVLHAIGTFSPPSYWEIVAEYAESGEQALRVEAAVALEQLAAPESLKTILAALRKEREPELARVWPRALAAAGAADKGARKTLLAGLKSKDPLVRRATLHSLGYLVPGDDVTEALRAALASKDEADRAAAITAMGLSRDGTAWLETLRALVPTDAAKGTAPEGEGGTPGESPPQADPAKAAEPLDVRAARAAITVLEGGGLAKLRPVVEAVTEDTRPRERVYGFDNSRVIQRE